MDGMDGVQGSWGPFLSFTLYSFSNPHPAMSVGNATSATRTAAHTEEVLLWNEFPDALLFSIVDQVG